MVNHQNAIIAFCQFNQFLGFFDCAGHWFLYQHVLVSFQCLLCQRMMSEHRCSQDDRVYFSIVQYFVCLGRHFNGWVPFACGGAPLRAQINAPFDLNAIGLVQVPKEIRTPVTVTDQADFYIFCNLHFKSDRRTEDCTP